MTDGPLTMRMEYEPSPSEWTVVFSRPGKKDLVFRHAGSSGVPSVFVDFLLASRALMRFAEQSQLEPLPADDAEALKRLLKNVREDLEDLER